MNKHSMRQRDTGHEHRLQGLLASSPEDCKQQIAVADYRSTGYVASEVLASIIRLRFGQSTGVLSAATEELNRRVVKMVEIHIRRKPGWRMLERNSSEVIVDAISYFWTTFMADSQTVCNAEVRFAVYLGNKVDDHMKHLLTEENTRTSVDGMMATDEDGDEMNFIDTIEDANCESPEAVAIRSQESKKIMSSFMALPHIERNAFYFRVECGYDWKAVAQFLGCSIPTAREYVNRSLQKLRGALNDQSNQERG